VDNIAGRFLTESAALGGLVGTSPGTVTVVATAAVGHWTPVNDPATIAVAPSIGLITGLLAGLHPAWCAARIEPVEALRR